MTRRKRNTRQLWWRRRRPLRRLALAAFAAVVTGFLVWLVVARGGGSDGTGEYLREQAPPFSLPTIAGDQVSLGDHVGRHALLLYFNEGMG